MSFLHVEARQPLAAVMRRTMWRGAPTASARARVEGMTQEPRTRVSAHIPGWQVHDDIELGQFHEHVCYAVALREEIVVSRERHIVVVISNPIYKEAFLLTAGLSVLSSNRHLMYEELPKRLCKYLHFIPLYV